MARGKKPPEEKEKDYSDKIHYSHVATVEGVSFAYMLLEAKRKAAALWRTSVDAVRVVEHSPMKEHTWARFEKEKRPTTWTMQVILEMIPEEARTGGHLASVTPITEEGDSPD